MDPPGSAGDLGTSIVIALLIVPRAWSLLCEAADILLEAVPRGVDLEEVRRHLLETPGVIDVHDLHAWSITSGLPVMSAHVVMEGGAPVDGSFGQVLDRLHECLAGHFDVEHSTLQPEPAGHTDHEGARHRRDGEVPAPYGSHIRHDVELLRHVETREPDE